MHRVLRISDENCFCLHSKERVPYHIIIEVAYDPEEIGDSEVNLSDSSMEKLDQSCYDEVQQQKAKEKSKKSVKSKYIKPNNSNSPGIELQENKEKYKQLVDDHKTTEDSGDQVIFKNTLTKKQFGEDSAIKSINNQEIQSQGKGAKSQLPPTPVEQNKIVIDTDMVKSDGNDPSIRNDDIKLDIIDQ